jgi:hypothetical protein
MMGGGIGGAILTMGGTLVVSAYGCRRYQVATKKLELIQAELLSRGVSLHEVNYKDVLIPFAANIVGQGAGFGFDQIATEAANTMPTGQQIPTATGSTVINEVVANPSDTVQATISGIEAQSNAMGHALDGIGGGIIPGSDPSQLNLATHTSSVAAPNIESITGFHTGMLLAQSAEKAAVSLIASNCAWKLMEAMSSMDPPRTRLPCARMVGQTVKCDHCHTLVQSGTYWRKSLPAPICCRIMY